MVERVRYKAACLPACLQGVVERVRDKYVAEVCMLDSGDVVRVDQAQLETVLPSPGGSVLCVNGQYRGSKASLMSIDVDKFQAQVCAGVCGGGCTWVGSGVVQCTL